MAKLIWILKDHWQTMLQDVSRQAPLEACGLVAGLGNRSQAVYPITNELRSPVNYRMAPREQYEAFINIEHNNWELLAIYHSHPAGPEGPSPTDVAEFAYPGTLSIIWRQDAAGWNCRTYQIIDGKVDQITIQVCKS